MGYSTDFYGSINIEPPLPSEVATYINDFCRSRRMARNMEVLMERYPDVREYGFPCPDGSYSYGEDGEYFVIPNGSEGSVATVPDNNRPPRSQPGLWCKWRISNDGSYIEWNGAEKFYEADEWMQYIITHFIAPWGCKCNGTINAQGEEHDDTWDLVVKDNVVTVKDRSRCTMEKNLKALSTIIAEIDSIVKHIEYSEHYTGLLASASEAQLELLTEVKGRLNDAVGKYKSFVEE